MRASVRWAHKYCIAAKRDLKKKELEDKVATLEEELKVAASNTGQQTELNEKEAEAKSEDRIPTNTTQEMERKMVKAIKQKLLADKKQFERF